MLNFRVARALFWALLRACVATFFSRNDCPEVAYQQPHGLKTHGANILSATPPAMLDLRLSVLLERGFFFKCGVGAPRGKF